ncbi:MAG: carotenoid oxygenase family protein [Nannocystis sp.]|nr:carotenoid oxygenase family protein [Nannocystis sp.]MBA3548392.1 carotenoid oxygenase family protein [Nannocystis sp.]
MSAAPATAAAASLDPIDLREAYLRSNESITDEVEGHLEVVEGELPAGLRGVLFRNGPGRLEVHGQPYGHPFDGDGHLNRFAFTDQGVVYRNRYVRTREFLDEEAARKILYRNFGTNIPGGFRKNLLRMRFKNVANTSVVMHGGQLRALWEGGLPHRIDPHTLDTLARDDLGGALQNDSSFIDRLIAPELPYSAHPRLDPATGDLFNFGTVSGMKPALMLYRQNHAGAVVQRERLVLPAMSFLHDFTVTPRFRVFFLTPVAFDLPRTLLGLAPPASTLHAMPGPTTILLLPRRGTQARSYSARPCFIFHFANAFEDGPYVVVDADRMDRLPSVPVASKPRPGQFAAEYPRTILTRFIIDTRSGLIEERALTDYTGELPTINPAYWTRPHRYTWSLGTSLDQREPFSTGLLKVDAETRSSVFRDLRPNLTGEPIFVPRPGSAAEDDGWILSMCYDPRLHTGELLVLDAADLRTVCRLRMPHHSPLGFHGTWVGALSS